MFLKKKKRASVGSILEWVEPFEMLVLSKTGYKIIFFGINYHYNSLLPACSELISMNKSVEGTLDFCLQQILFGLKAITQSQTFIAVGNIY